MKRSEVWLVNLDPTQGAEIRKTRPAVIVSDDSVGLLPLRVVVPITERQEAFARFPWMVCLAPQPENGLSKTSAADAFQVRSIAQGRFVKQLGRLSDEQMDAVARALAKVLRIPIV